MDLEKWSLQGLWHKWFQRFRGGGGRGEGKGGGGDKREMASQEIETMRRGKFFKEL